MPFSSPAQIKRIATTVVCHNDKSPFTPGAHIQAVSPSGDTLYGANHPGELDVTKFARLKPGATNANAAITVPTALNDMHDLGTAITAATRLRVIAVKNPRVSGGTVLKRVANDATCAAGEFQETDANTLKFGDALLAGDEIDLYVLSAADIVTLTGGAMTAARIYEIASYLFMTNTTNPVDIQPVAHA